jgi:hypothetical protein
VVDGDVVDVYILVDWLILLLLLFDGVEIDDVFENDGGIDDFDEFDAFEFNVVGDNDGGDGVDANGLKNAIIIQFFLFLLFVVQF